MPMNDQVLGTNADGSKNEDYCMCCYKEELMYDYEKSILTITNNLFPGILQRL